MGVDSDETGAVGLDAGMGMIGMVRLERRGVREGWKVMFERSMAPRDDKVAVCVCKADMRRRAAESKRAVSGMRFHIATRGVEGSPR